MRTTNVTIWRYNLLVNNLVDTRLIGEPYTIISLIELLALDRYIWYVATKFYQYRPMFRHTRLDQLTIWPIVFAVPESTRSVGDAVHHQVALFAGVRCSRPVPTCRSVSATTWERCATLSSCCGSRACRARTGGWRHLANSARTECTLGSFANLFVSSGQIHFWKLPQAIAGHTIKQTTHDVVLLFWCETGRIH